MLDLLSFIAKIFKVIVGKKLLQENKQHKFFISKLFYSSGKKKS